MTATDSSAAGHGQSAGGESRRIVLEQLSGALPWVVSVAEGERSRAAAAPGAATVVFRAAFAREADAQEIAGLLSDDGRPNPTDQKLDGAAFWVELNAAEQRDWSLIIDPRPGMRDRAADVLARTDPLGDRASVRATAADVSRFVPVPCSPYGEMAVSALEKALAQPSDETFGQYALQLANAADMADEHDIALALRESVARRCTHRKTREDGAYFAARDHERRADGTTGPAARLHLTSALGFVDGVSDGAVGPGGAAPSIWMNRAQLRFKLGEFNPGEDARCRRLCERTARVEGESWRGYRARHMIRALEARAAGAPIVWAEGVPLIETEERNPGWLASIAPPPAELIDDTMPGLHSCARPAYELAARIDEMTDEHGNVLGGADAAEVRSLRIATRALRAEAVRRSRRYPFPADPKDRNQLVEVLCLEIARDSWLLGDEPTAYAAYRELLHSERAAIGSEALFSREAIRYVRAGATGVMTSIGVRLTSQVAGLGL